MTKLELPSGVCLIHCSAGQDKSITFTMVGKIHNTHTIGYFYENYKIFF